VLVLVLALAASLGARSRPGRACREEAAALAK
jgi:hypothetical protein